MADSQFQYPPKLFAHYKAILTPSLMLTDGDFKAIIKTAKVHKPGLGWRGLMPPVRLGLWEAYYCLICAIMAYTIGNRPLAWAWLNYLPLKFIGKTCTGNSLARKRFFALLSHFLELLATNIILDATQKPE